ncbi:MAG: glycosyltransferase family 39 protein [Candidatus Omnitrophica bacterium]|nr:glycosyltransferase family 39 protein [Candidatus Omnitrophota bacterium]MBU4479002.1 glycosyltransferase family 39 protein [Candidatus Omnitrophota bacterium]
MVEFVNIYFQRPPLYYFAGIIINPCINNLLLTQQYLLPLMFFIISIIYTFRLSEYIAKDSGIYSVLLLSIFPGMILHVQGINLYSGQISVLIMAFYYFLRSDFFENRRYSVVFGLVFGWGMLIKEQFPVFFIGPFFILAILFLKKKKTFNSVNFSLFLISFFASGILFFIPFQFLNYVKHEPFIPTFSSFTFQLSAYGEGLMQALSPPLTAIFLIAALGSLLRKRTVEILFMSSLVGAVLIFSFYKVQGGRAFHWYYISACLPLIAIIIGVYFKKYGKLSFACALSVALLIYPFTLCNINEKDYERDLLTNQIMNYMIGADSECNRMLFWGVDINVWDQDLHPALRGIVRFMSSKNLYSRYVCNFLQALGEEIKRDLRIGILRQSGASLLAADLQTYLKKNGFSDCVGGVGFPNADLYLNKNSYDVFIYISDNPDIKWPRKETLNCQVEQLLPELKKDITEEDINRLLRLEKEMEHVGVSPYSLTREGNFSYVHVFVNKKITPYKETAKIIR